jgi:AcrR family transcriptional regulator
MTGRARAQSRKRPLQARAQATVNAILEATVQVLGREGLDAASTTRIAEVASVSVGSLYQYFSHRDAILDALQDREFDRAIGLMQDVLADGNLTNTPRETVTAVVRGLAKLYGASPGLHRVLAIEGLRVAKADGCMRSTCECSPSFAAFSEAPRRGSDGPTWKQRRSSRSTPSARRCSRVYWNIRRACGKLRS